LFALAMAALTGFSAISLDAGQMYATRSRLANVADAAALAGASFLPEDPAGAIAAALDCAARNGLAPETVQVALFEQNTRIEVNVRGPAELRFAQVAGSHRVNLTADSLGAVGIVTGIVGAQPFGVEQAPFVFGGQYAIKLGPEGSSLNGVRPYSGNFHALALGGSGAARYRENIVTGYAGLLTVGDQIDTEPGNMAGPTSHGVNARLAAAPGETWQSYAPRSPRVLFVPIVDSLAVSGRKAVRIIGFAAFFLEGFDPDGDGCVIGTFLRHHTEGQLTAYRPELDFGLRGVRLIH
jgi:hypothetical protein